jgi:hypothetical protein
MSVPDKSLTRRVAYLERRINELELNLVRQTDIHRTVTPLSSRLWRFELLEDFDAQHFAAANLLTVHGDDTGKNVEIYDPEGFFEDAGVGNGDAGYCLEQICICGDTLWVAIQPRGTTQKKPFCTFKANGSFTTTSASVAGTIQTQFGEGQDHASTSATFYNLDESGGDYVFEGDTNDWGIALYSGTSTYWYIVQMECPTT